MKEREKNKREGKKERKKERKGNKNAEQNAREEEVEATSGLNSFKYNGPFIEPIGDKTNAKANAVS